MPREGIVPTVLARIRALATLLLYVGGLPPSPRLLLFWMELSVRFPHPQELR